MASLPVDPITDPAAWAAVVIADLEYAYCEVSGFDREYDWDEKKGKGAKGATTTFVGQTLAKGSVKFYAWEKEHFEGFDAILRAIKYDPTKKSSQAVEIWHPALREVDVGAVVAKKIGPWHHDGDSMYTRDVEFLEYRPPPKVSAVSTPAGAAAAGDRDKAGAGAGLDPAIKAAQDEFTKTLGDAKSKGPLF